MKNTYTIELTLVSEIEADSQEEALAEFYYDLEYRGTEEFIKNLKINDQEIK